MMVRRSVLAAAVVAMMICRSSASFEPEYLTCATAATLDQLSDCLAPLMPPPGSNGFVPPTPQQASDWRAVVRDMLDGACGPELPLSLGRIMQRRTFRDRENGRTYCLLMEVLDANNDGRVDRGWGTFIVNPTASRELHHHVPHPGSDAETDDQAIGIFRDTDSRAFLLAGAHRRANLEVSACQRSYAQADVAHNAETMFHATNEALVSYYGTRPWWVIQWHGMAATDCRDVDVYMSGGRDVEPPRGHAINDLAAEIAAQHPSWQIAMPGSNRCNLNGTFNVQGRLLNGVAPADVCRTPADQQSGRFLHIEQDPPFRTAEAWSEAVARAWPAAAP